MSVADSWRALLQQGRKEAGWHSIRIEPDARIDVQVGVRQPDGGTGGAFSRPIKGGSWWNALSRVCRIRPGARAGPTRPERDGPALP